MAKDPAFTFYYKDWLVSTAGWDADLRGWYMNLLCHQADKPEGLPDDLETLAELAGVKHSLYVRFGECWKRTLKAKFEANEHGHLANAALAERLSERRGYTEKQAERGVIGYFIKKARHEYGIDDAVAKALYIKLKEEKFISIPKENRDACFKRTLEALLGSVNGNVNGNIVENKGGTGGEGDPSPLPPMKPGQFPVHQLMEIWLKQFPAYPADQDLDFKALWQISEFIRKQKALANDYTAETKTTIAAYWQELVTHIGTDGHFVKYNLQQVLKFIQSIIQSHNAPKQSGGKTDTEVQYLYDLFLEKGKVQLKQIGEAIYCRLNEKGLLPPVSDAKLAEMVPIRINHLESARPAHWERLRDAYTAPERTDEQKKLLDTDRPTLQLHARRLLVLDFFSVQATAGQTNVFTTKKTA